MLGLHGISLPPSLALWAGAISVLALAQAGAQQEPTAGPQSVSSSAAVENNGQDFTRPENLFQLRYLFRTSPGTGSSPGTIRTVTTDFAVLRSDFKFAVADQWTFVVRGDLPVDAKNPITPSNPNGDYLYGLGDAFAQAALIKTLNERWAAGAASPLSADRGGPDRAKRQALPIVGAREMLPELSEGSFFTGLLRYDVSFAGSVSSRNINNLQIAPTLSIMLPRHWFVTFYPDPDIRFNFGDPATGQTGRLFLPADFLVGRDVTKNVTVSLEIGVPLIKDYPVYDFKTVARLNMKF